MCNYGVPPIGVTNLRGVARGQLINRLCASLLSPEGRRAFCSNEDAYCLQFGLNREEREAVKDRDFSMLIVNGAHVAQLNALAALSGLNILDAIRQRRGLRILE